MTAVAARRVDVAVVGAGPAGAATALLLARRGLDVALLDRHAFPRPKPCGDCLSPEAARVLHRLGVLDPVLRLGPARLAGWRIVSPAGFAFTGYFPAAGSGWPPAIAIERHRFDQVLVDAARHAGARLLTGWRVTDLVRDGARVAGVVARGPGGEPVSVSARLVVGADGLRSVIATRLGLVRRPPRIRKISLTAHLRGLAPRGGVGEMHLADGACIGIAPVEAAHHAAPCNVTLVVDGRRFAPMLAGDAAGFFRRALRWFPALAGRVAAADDQLAEPGAARRILASGPFDRPGAPVSTDGAVLVGDAAGYFDPFTGQGIYQALAAAEALAHRLGPALGRRRVSARHLRAYARDHARVVRHARALQRVIEFITARPALADRAIRRLAAAPAAADTLVAVTGDLVPPHALLSVRLAISFLAGSQPETAA